MNVKEFLEFLFKKEQIAIDARHNKDKFDEYNKLAEDIKQFMNDDSVGFGLPKFRKLQTDDYYEDFKKMPYPTKRHIYKISEYQNQKYGKLWACYVSNQDPGEGLTQLLASCFIVAKIDNLFKIIAKFNPDYITKEWERRGGDDLNYYDLGELIKVERFMSPVNDEWSIKEYNKEA